MTTLTYRGIAYKAQTITLDTPQTSVVAKYRGQSYQLSQSQIFSPNTNTDSMVYRGVSYNTTTSIPGQVIAQTV